MTPQEKARAKRLMDCFLLTVAQWDALNTFQRGLCFLCGRQPPAGKRLATDHNHATAEIRGLLCPFCNRLLGKVERFWSVEILQKVIDYLTNPPARIVFGHPHIGYPGRVTTKKHRKMLRKLAKQTANTAKRTLSDAERIHDIVQRFRKNCTYSIDEKQLLKSIINGS